MNQSKMDMFRNRLTKVLKHLGRQAMRQKVFCYRLYDHDLPEFPFCIERYEDLVYLAEYKRHHSMSDEVHDAWLSDCIGLVSHILEVKPEKIFLRQRQRKAGRQGQYEKLATEATLFDVREGGLKFKVNLKDYLDTGLFLDHRITRQMVRENAAGKNVLNLFCYTGSFSVYAAAGGASQVDSVDLSKTYLQWAKENMSLNATAVSGKHNFIHADVKQFLEKVPADYYDCVIMDPPTFSNSKRMTDFLDIQRDHASLINSVLRAMKKDGTLYFSTNYRKFVLDTPGIQSSGIRDITKATTPFDFQGRLFRSCFRITKSS